MTNFTKYSNFSSAIESRVLNYINFENLMRIEYLDNFITDKDTISTSNLTLSTTSLKNNVKNPIWKTMTSEEYQKIGTENYVLCRLVPYENSQLKLSINPSHDIIIYFISDNINKINITFKIVI